MDRKEVFKRAYEIAFYGRPYRNKVRFDRSMRDDLEAWGYHRHFMFQGSKLCKLYVAAYMHEVNPEVFPRVEIENLI